MRKRIIVATVLVISLISTAGHILLGGAQKAQAAELIKTASQKIVTPEPGQIAHYTYNIYRRVPPANLEPSDPYHMPYSEIWRENQVEETWFEVDSSGNLARWRTKLYSARGDLLQDIVFDGQTELTYFTMQGQAFTIKSEVKPFVDYRVKLFSQFLASPDIRKRNGTTPDGKSVISVYLSQENIEGSVPDVTTARLNFNMPFVSDLQPISTALRIDFDPESSKVAGTAEVVYDNSGTETIISYRTFSDPDTIVSSGDPQANNLFDLSLPEYVVPNRAPISPTPSEIFTDLSQVEKLVDFPLYVFPEGLSTLKLMSVDFARVEPESSTGIPANVFSTIDNAWQTGNVRLLYAISGSDAAINASSTLTLIQGPTKTMLQSLKATWPTWVTATQSNFEIGGVPITGWILSDEQNKSRIKYVIETTNTLLYFDTTALTTDQFTELLAEIIVKRNRGE